MEIFVINLRTYTPILDVDPLEVHGWPFGTIGSIEVANRKAITAMVNTLTTLANDGVQAVWMSGDMGTTSTWRYVRYRCQCCNALMGQVPCLSEMCRDMRAAARGWNVPTLVASR